MRAALFTPAKGNKVCPKCGGDTELDITPRDSEHWPTGPIQRMTCDFCEGIGEVAQDKPNASAFNIAEKALVDNIIKSTEAVAASINKLEAAINPKYTLDASGPGIVPATVTEVEEQPKIISGWAVFQK